MACDLITKGRTLPCKNSRIGIKYVDFANFDSANVYSVTGQEIATLPAGLDEVFRYQVKATGNTLVETATVDLEKRTTEIKQVLNLVLQKTDVMQSIGITSATRVTNGIITINTTPTAGGTGYTGAVGVATTGGTGSGLTVDTTDTAGVVTAISINSRGSGYTINDVITITGGGANATFVVTSVSSDDFSNVANVVSGVINTTGCEFIATGTTPTNYTNGSTLTDTSAPVATVLENTLSGTPVWSRTGVGTYLGTLTGEFAEDKTAFYHVSGYPGGIRLGWNNANSVYLQSYDSGGVAPKHK